MRLARCWLASLNKDGAPLLVGQQLRPFLLYTFTPLSSSLDCLQPLRLAEIVISRDLLHRRGPVDVAAIGQQGPSDSATAPGCKAFPSSEPLTTSWMRLLVSISDARMQLKV